MIPIRWFGNSSTRIKFLSGPSLRMKSYSTGPPQIQAQWLRRVLNDHNEPPRLYAWTLANLPSGHKLSEETQSRNDDERRRIYILGIGNIGRLYASFLANNSSRPPITLVVHKRELLEHWRSDPGIELVRNNGEIGRNADFDIEWWTDARPSLGPVKEPAGEEESGGGSSNSSIRNLIITTKATDAMPQVDKLRRYLSAESTVAFAQNGMCKLWPPIGEAYITARFPAGTGPEWLACVTTHGVTSLGPFRSVHASPADVMLGTVRRRESDGDDVSGSHYLAEQLTKAPGLAAREVPTRELWVAQLEKLVINSVINPLTAVLRCKNGEVFFPYSAEEEDGLTGVIDLLLQEASRTLSALVLRPSSDDILLPPPNEGGDKDRLSLRDATREELLERFAFARLKTMVYAVGEKVKENTSSMLQDVRAGKKTEVEDFNGWLVETARFLGDVRGLPAHEKLISLVVGEAVLTRRELCDVFSRVGG
ncbi:6-phosphogluconate dehydrogenase C-terminal domain-like protein [Hypoxylon fragiforme]|uniref:6-phosphogluconate dehydrogenase C-terminal domain-like protein n=1 Tax=Hypoxylon fragiforme TaxID=63214 RepID=UPI0020C63FB9|nr:6-phosphogluconate dehydrogenase C-terminal domain-like protein [Hypoxylon fragiforme]KAI2612587.1 6-phosphogluconate dehydrogenase C-terminal domain-like protein [Hypoxylon fragiforme]